MRETPDTFEQCSSGRGEDCRRANFFNVYSVRDSRAFRLSAGDDEIDRLRSLALLVGLDIEADPLSFCQAFHAGLFDCGNVHEHITSAIIRFDEPVAALPVEKLDSSRLSHRETPFPAIATPAAPTDDGSAGHSQSGKASACNGLSHSAGLPREAERQSQPHQ